MYWAAVYARYCVSNETGFWPVSSLMILGKAGMKTNNCSKCKLDTLENGGLFWYSQIKEGTNLVESGQEQLYKEAAWPGAHMPSSLSSRQEGKEKHSRIRT